MVGFTLPKRFRSNLPSLCSGKMKRFFLWGSKQRPSLLNLVSKTDPTWLGGFYFCSPLFGKVSSTLTIFGLGGLKPPSYINSWCLTEILGTSIERRVFQKQWGESSKTSNVPLWVVGLLSGGADETCCRGVLVRSTKRPFPSKVDDTCWYSMRCALCFRL